MQCLVNERREFYFRYLQTPWCYPLNKMVSVVITLLSHNTIITKDADSIPMYVDSFVIQNIITC